jgi:hypothetical protein
MSNEDVGQLVYGISDPEVCLLPFELATRCVGDVTEPCDCGGVVFWAAPSRLLYLRCCWRMAHRCLFSSGCYPYQSVIPSIPNVRLCCVRACAGCGEAPCA